MTRPSKCNLASRLRRGPLVVFEQPTTPTSGEIAPTYSTAFTCRAEILPLRGREGLHGDQVEATTTWRVTFRYRSDVNASWRIKWGARYLGIVSVYDPDQMGRVLICQCEEVKP